MREFEKEIIQRYRNLYPSDPRGDFLILEEFKRVRKNRGKYVEGWIMFQVFQEGGDKDGQVG